MTKLNKIAYRTSLLVNSISYINSIIIITIIIFNVKASPTDYSKYFITKINLERAPLFN